MNETLIYHYIVELIGHLSEWKAACKNQPKTQESAGKVTVNVFWELHCIIIIDYIEKNEIMKGLKWRRKKHPSIRVLQFLPPATLLQSKRFGWNGEVIWETETYLEDLDNSFCKKDIEMLLGINYNNNHSWWSLYSCVKPNF